MKTEQYIQESERTLAGPENHKGFFVSNYQMIHELVGLVQAGFVADIMKRAMFYGSSIEACQAKTDDYTQHLKTVYELNFSKMNAELPDVEFTKDEINVLHAILGIFSEAAELADKFIECKLAGKELDKNNMVEEAGDIYWYLAILHRFMGVPVEEVMEKNITKLKLRFPDKFNSEQAHERDLDEEQKVFNT